MKQKGKRFCVCDLKIFFLKKFYNQKLERKFYLIGYTNEGNSLNQIMTMFGMSDYEI